jgi:hypothetical protein
MIVEKLAELDLSVRIGSFVTIAPAWEFPAGVDLTGLTAQFVLAVDQGPVLLDLSTPVIVDPLLSNHGRVRVRLTDVVTKQLHFGKKQHYHFKIAAPRSD